MRSTKTTRDQIKQELQDSGYDALLAPLQDRSAFLLRFRTWDEVLAFMQEGTSQDPRKNEILRLIFLALSQDGDPRWRSILLLIFWPGLENLHGRKWRWDQDKNDLWQNLIWCFLRVISRMKVHESSRRLVQKVINATIRMIYKEYECEWNRKTQEITLPPHKIEALVDCVPDIDFFAIEYRERQEMEIERLRMHRDKGRISDADFLLIVGTRVYGKTVTKYAREMGMKYQTAKKRRQRAEARIRLFEND